MTAVSPHEKLEKILEAYRKGTCDKPRALGLVGTLRVQLSPSEAEELKKSLLTRFESADMTTGNQVGGYIVNEATFALSCLAEFCSFQELLESVMLRFPIGNVAKIEAWSREMVPELQWILQRRPELLDSESLLLIRTKVALVHERAYVYSPVAVSAMDTLEGTAGWIEFERFEKTLLSGKPSAIELGASLEGQPIERLSDTVADALSEARKRLDAQGPFDPKTAADLVRAVMEEAHRVIVQQLSQTYGATDAETDGARRHYMQRVGFITKAEEKFFSAIYSLISEEASHKLIAPRETVLLLHETVSNYVLLLNERLRRRLPPIA
jgi:hypothetical protein